MAFIEFSFYIANCMALRDNMRFDPIFHFAAANYFEWIWQSPIR